MRFNDEGRVLVGLDGPIVAFNGGTPTNAAGEMVVEDNPPDAYLGGYGFRAHGPICARAGLGDGNDPGGFARNSVGGLALATEGPIVGYIAGVPVVADGRMAVAFEGPPPVDFHGFNTGFDQTAFD